MKVPALARWLALVLAGAVAGAVVTMAVQSPAGSPASDRTGSAPAFEAPTKSETPETFLAWTPGGLPGGFREAVAALPGIERSVVVAGDNTWMTRSYSADGQVVDDPPKGFAIPLEVGAVDPSDFAPFLPPADRGATLALENAQGILGESSARLRGLGPGAVLEFGSTRVQIAAILPDELVGAKELMVSTSVGREIGVTHDRYALLQPDPVPNDRQLAKQIRGILPPGLKVQVRAPGETPYFREGDAVLPPVRIKELFGEFAAKPDPKRPGYLLIDPQWERTHIVTGHVPLLGAVTCNVAMFPQIRGAMNQLIAEGLADTISSFSGCYARRFANRDPTAAISHHSWGIALDINVPQNPFGAMPNQDPGMVKVFEEWGFIWGGDFIRPDGMHFEYRRPPAGSLGGA